MDGADGADSSETGEDGESVSARADAPGEDNIARATSGNGGDGGWTGSVRAPGGNGGNATAEAIGTGALAVEAVAGPGFGGRGDPVGMRGNATAIATLVSNRPETISARAEADRTPMDATSRATAENASGAASSIAEADGSGAVLAVAHATGAGSDEVSADATTFAFAGDSAEARAINQGSGRVEARASGGAAEAFGSTAESGSVFVVAEAFDQSQGSDVATAEGHSSGGGSVSVHARFLPFRAPGDGRLEMLDAVSGSTAGALSLDQSVWVNGGDIVRGSSPPTPLAATSR